MEKKTILVAEDEPSSNRLICITLKESGFGVLSVTTGKEACSMASSHLPDLVMLNLGLPDMDGTEVISDIRRWSSVPIIVVSARSREAQKVAALDAGADDYLTKPFAMKELLARIRAMTRRKNDVISTYTVGNLTLDPKQYTLKAEKGEVRLSGKEFQMMEMLVANNNMLISTEKFMESVWGYDSEAEINGVWVYISSLRKKLSEIGANVNIKAVRGLGYKLEETK